MRKFRTQKENKHEVPSPSQPTVKSHINDTTGYDSNSLTQDSPDIAPKKRNERNVGDRAMREQSEDGGSISIFAASNQLRFSVSSIEDKDSKLPDVNRSSTKKQHRRSNGFSLTGFGNETIQ